MNKFLTLGLFLLSIIFSVTFFTVPAHADDGSSIDINIVASKIVCSSESDLPNWGLGGPAITANTTSEFLNSHPNCHLESGWSFQWASSTVPDPGPTFVGEASGWNTFGPTNQQGVAATAISIPSDTPYFWVREVLKNDYIPFTYPGDNNSYSAEMYCHANVFNYDNYDGIGSPFVSGNTYYCVAFNALKSAPPPANTPPTITLIGANPFDLVVGMPFVDPGTTATDTEDGNLTSHIITTGTVNASSTGTYILTYSVTDSGGLSASTTRTVNVIDMYLPQMPPCSGNFGKVTSSVDAWGFNTDNVPEHYTYYQQNEPSHGDTLDNTWVWAGNNITWPWASSATPSIQWDLNQSTKKVRVYPSQDHGPYSGQSNELNEYDVQVSLDGINWTPASSTATYIDDLNNIRTHDGVKDFISETPFRYVKIAPNAIGGGDYEIDAIQSCTTEIPPTPPVVPPVNPPANNGGGGGGGGIGGHRHPVVVGEILGATSCSYLRDYLKIDWQNDPIEVLKLQSFLNVFEKENLSLTGVFGQATFEAVQRFQVKYKGDILEPWGPKVTTGFVYILTKKKINEIYCNNVIPTTQAEQNEIDAFNSGSSLPSPSSVSNVLNNVSNVPESSPVVELKGGSTTNQSIVRNVAISLFALPQKIFSDWKYMLLAIILIAIIVAVIKFLTSPEKDSYDTSAPIAEMPVETPAEKESPVIILPGAGGEKKTLGIFPDEEIVVENPEEGPEDIIDETS